MATTDWFDTFKGTDMYEEQIAKRNNLENINDSIQLEKTIEVKPKSDKEKLVMAVRPKSKKKLSSRDDTPGKFDPSQSYSFHASLELVTKIKVISVLEGCSIKSIINDSLNNWIKSYERKEGEIELRG